MKFFNMIKRLIRRLLFWKKRKRSTGVLTEQIKNFYDEEVIKRAQAVGPIVMFGGQHYNQPHGGVEVKFKRYTNLSSDTGGATVPQGKVGEDPCGTCLRWPECEGVDRECPLRK